MRALSSARVIRPANASRACASRSAEKLSLRQASRIAGCGAGAVALRKQRAREREAALGGERRFAGEEAR